MCIRDRIQSLTVLENVELPLVYQGIGADDRRDLALEALERVGLRDRIKHKPAEMSGGQQQRVAIARAIATHPPIIMADEPTGALDSHTGQEVLRFLQELNKEGSTVILSLIHIWPGVQLHRHQGYRRGGQGLPGQCGADGYGRRPAGLRPVRRDELRL